MGERVAQHVRNIVLSDYCNKIKAKCLLSGTEYALKNSCLILNELVYEIPKNNGIVAFSLFQMPEDAVYRRDIYKRILSKKG